MPAGQAQTIWFPELKEILEYEWNPSMIISQQFDLLTKLNNKLIQIRKDLDIQPPMMWCNNCQKRHRSKFRDVSITAMYYALQRFEICKEKDFKELKKVWNKYSKSENIDIYGKPKIDKDRNEEKPN
jgi:hypothetical protein